MKEKCHGWWDCRSPRTQMLLRYSALPVGFAVLVFIDWIRHHSEGRASQEEARLLFWRVGIVSYLAAVMMALFTPPKTYTLQLLGLFGLLLAGAELKFRLLAQEGPQPVPEWERDLIHSFFEVSALAVLLSVTIYAIARITRRNGSDQEDHSDDLRP